MGANLDRAQVLFEQSRYEHSERALRQELAVDPDNPRAHALLGLCLAAGRRDGAVEAARQAVALAPDLAFGHYALADILSDRDDHIGAASAIHEAIRLDPDMPNYHALLAGIEFKLGRWEWALVAACRGLAIDPGHVGCLNLRAMALVKLQRAKEADAVFVTALSHDPNNAVTHANLGWALLEQGNAAPALHHFREALRLDADFDRARQGVTEAFKARYFGYQLLLRFVLWMARMSRWGQWTVLLGGVVGYVAIELLAYVYQDLQVFIIPIQAVCILFAVLAWIADPLFNLVLRLDRVGRLSLSAEQVRASNFVGICLLAATGSVIVWIFTRSEAALESASEAALESAGMFALLTLPVTGIFDCPHGWPRRVMTIYTLTLLVSGVARIILLSATQNGILAAQHGILLAVLFGLGTVSSPWLVLVLLYLKSRR
jgi:tetratricopeptide (TPR) repeat protein